MNKNQASNTFFLDFCVFNIEDKSINITAKAQGFILSQRAAGTNIKKNFILSEILIVDSISPEAKDIQKKIKNNIIIDKAFFILIFVR